MNVYIVTACNFLLILVYTRALGPERFGSLVTSQAQVLIWVMLVDLGLYGGLISALTQAEADKSELTRQGFRAWDLVWRVLGIRTAGACLGTVAIVSLAYMHARDESGQWNAQRFWQDIAFAPHLFALAFQQTFTAYVNFRGRFMLGIIGNIAGVATSAGLSAYLAFRGESISVLLLAQCWGGFLAGTIILLGLWRRPTHQDTNLRLQRTSGGAWKNEAWASLFRDAWPYALIFAASVLWQRLDQIVASHYLGFAAGGQYALAVRLMAIPMMVANAVYIAIVPDMQRVGRDAPEKAVIYVTTIGKVLFRYGIPLAAFLLLLIHAVMIPLFPKFSGARGILFWFVPGIWGYWLQNFFMAALYALRQFKQVVWVHIYSLLIYVVALLGFVQVFGLVGVVWSYDIFCVALAYFSLRALRHSDHLATNFALYQKYTARESEFLRMIWRRVKPWSRVANEV